MIEKLLDQDLGLQINYCGNMYKLKIKKSNIQGVGIFAEQDIPAGSNIGIVIERNFTVTPFGSKLNHSWFSNGNLVEHENRWYYVTNRFIPAGSELTMDYRKTPYFIKKPNPNWK